MCDNDAPDLGLCVVCEEAPANTKDLSQAYQGNGGGVCFKCAENLRAAHDELLMIGCDGWQHIARGNITSV